MVYNKSSLAAAKEIGRIICMRKLRAGKVWELDKILTYKDVLNISMLTNSLFTISLMDV